MQIDLYNNASVMEKVSRVSKQIETRDFKLAQDLTKIKEINPDIFAKVEELSKASRQYELQAGGANDNLFLLEILGVGKYCKKYSVVLDMSDCLDYILHRLSGCSISSVRQLQDYDNISKNIIGLNFDELQNLTFSDLFALDDKLAKYLSSLIRSASEDYTDPNRIIQEFVLKFYTEVVSEVSSIKDYCMMFLQQLNPGSFVYRSKSYTSSVATSDVAINEQIVIKANNCDDYELVVRSYEMFEYAKFGGIQ